jgi:hypothetical protein
MPISFNKAQSNLLADGFLNTLGSEQSAGVELSATVRKLVELGGFLITDAAKNLDRSGSNTTGDLSSSMTVKAPVKKGSAIAVDIELLERYKYIDKGVKGTKSGRGAFSFKTAFPSKKMVASIAGWMKERGMRVANVKQSYKKTEAKGQAVSNIGSAYAMAISIKQHGIEPTGFLSKAIVRTEKEMKELGKAFKADIIETLSNGNSNKS